MGDGTEEGEGGAGVMLVWEAGEVLMEDVLLGDAEVSVLDSELVSKVNDVEVSDSPCSDVVVVPLGKGVVVLDSGWLVGEPSVGSDSTTWKFFAASRVLLGLA